ncbi:MULTISPECIES: spore germination protein [Paenibacillus]|uniref:Membrane protein YfkQ n=1 Tax=Paenibacillus vini TaxID=1476024 RepID=A0ABQ4MBX7_9BACL|nr:MULTISPECIES: spore germination protein [Paenibacillus]MBQ4898357.1 spore germination protein [Paenibacillus sp. Marseille-P2973]MDN4069097.1 spore germination protein [Paenibacillus vini]GIP53506.1 putative membrane protein YfkQ [Paenibacillus vini]
MPIWRRPKHSGTTGGDKSKKTDGQPPNTLPPSRPSTGKSLENKLDWFQQQFKNCSDVIVRQFDLSSGQSSALIYIRGLINQTTAQDFIIRSLQEEADSLEKPEDIYKFLFEDKGLSVSQNKITEDMNEGLDAILDAGALLLIDGDNRMMTFSISSYPTRSIEEPPNESVIRGPRESFIEDLEINLTLMRRRLKNKGFKTESLIIGTKTKTDIVLTYIDGICKPELVDEMKRRLSYIEIDSVLGSSYIEESIEDNPYSPFPQVQYTERPDVVAAALLEGRLGLFVDGTPMALIVPVTLTMLLQSSEDYFQRFIAATWIRWIRFFFSFISLLLPSLYIAITTFHPEMIPPQFLRTIAAAREIVPFPAFLEAFMMELAFEALREASVRIPKSIGQAVSIIGALIIGTAAVEAGIVSAAMVIIVSLTGIASFIIPHFDLGLSFRLLRFPIMFLAAMFGLYGIACGLILIYIHLNNLASFGVPYLSPVAPLVVSDLKDTVVRAPWYKMHKRPLQTAAVNPTRQKKDSRGWAKDKG